MERKIDRQLHIGYLHRHIIFYLYNSTNSYLYKTILLNQIICNSTSLQDGFLTDEFDEFPLCVRAWSAGHRHTVDAMLTFLGDIPLKEHLFSLASSTANLNLKPDQLLLPIVILYCIFIGYIRRSSRNQTNRITYK